jgi:paraquat-inducible protein A
VSRLASQVSEQTRIACPECDLLGTAPDLLPGQRARCTQCGCVLTVCFDAPFSRALAFSVAGLIMLSLALGFPFLSISASGVTNSMTLFETVSYLADYGAEIIGVLVFVFIILVPVLMLTLMAVLSFCLRRGYFHQAMLAPTRWMYRLNAWSMVEVFAIGVIVSLVKLAAMAKVELGLSFWAYLAFAVLFLMAYSSLDRLTVWSSVDQIRSREAQT